MHRMIPRQHKTTQHLQGEVSRTPSPIFSPPVIATMPEPHMSYVSILTAEGTQRVPMVSTADVIPAGRTRSY